MSTRGCFGIIGDQAKLIATLGELADTALGLPIAARWAVVASRRSRSISTKNAGSAGSPNKVAQRAAKMFVGSSINGDRAGNEHRQRGHSQWQAFGKGRYPRAPGVVGLLEPPVPTAIELDECSVLIEQDSANG